MNNSTESLWRAAAARRRFTSQGRAVKDSSLGVE